MSLLKLLLEESNAWALDGNCAFLFTLGVTRKEIWVEAFTMNWVPNFATEALAFQVIMVKQLEPMLKFEEGDRGFSQTLARLSILLSCVACNQQDKP